MGVRTSMRRGVARMRQAPLGREARSQAGGVEDPVKRKFSADGADMAQFADIACLKTRQGRLHPAPAMDI